MIAAGKAVKPASLQTAGDAVGDESKDTSAGIIPKLYGSGNLKPSSYYRNRIKTFNDKSYIRKRYTPKTVKSMDRVLRIWKRYAPL